MTFHYSYSRNSDNTFRIVACSSSSPMPVMTYFRKAGQACGMTKKGYILISLGQFEHEIPLKCIRIKSFWSKKASKEI